MKKAAYVLVLLASPAFAQTPNLAPAPPVDRVGSPVKCIPIGKTSKGELVYSLDCRDIPVAIDQPQPVAPTVPEISRSKNPVGLGGRGYPLGRG
jgi:hypothetical protein